MVPAALFSATVNVVDVAENTGALLVPTTAEPLMAMRSAIPDEAYCQLQQNAYAFAMVQFVASPVSSASESV